MRDKFDAIVVGAGAIGLAIAWRAARLGLSILVVERAAHPGAGASGVAAGMLAPVTEAEFGANSLLQLNLESARRYPAFLEELADTAGQKIPISKGTMFVALDRDQLEALRRLYEFQESLGLQVQWLDHEATRKKEPALHPSAHAAIFAQGDLAIDPRVLLSALATALEREGGSLKTGGEVSEVVVEGGRARGVRLGQGGEVSASQVVVAAGCWSGSVGGIPAEVSESIRPVKGQILRLRPRGNEPGPIGSVVRTEEVYLVPREGGEVVAGATVEERGFDITVTAGAVFELLRAAEEAVPAIREMELAETSAGLRPGSRDNAPLIGPTSVEGLVAATGHWRNGILLAPVTADAVATFLAKGEVEPEIEPFLPGRFS